jgi:hypothetical protein
VQRWPAGINKKQIALHWILMFQRTVYPSLAKAIKLLEENATPEALSDSEKISRLVALVGKAAGPSVAAEEEEAFT